MAELLMPKATAVWLVDNTSLSFDQIADFCKLHPLEVKAIADGEAAQGIKGVDPVSTGQLSREDLDKAQKDEKFKLKLLPPRVRIPSQKRKRPRYTPVSKRQDRPNAIRWLIRNHPELKDAQIIRLVGTTKNTIEAIREGSHWNAANLQPIDPVTLGLCTQIALDLEVTKAAKNRPPEPMEGADGEHLLGVEQMQASQTQDSAQISADSTKNPADLATTAFGAALGAAGFSATDQTSDDGDAAVDASQVFSNFSDKPAEATENQAEVQEAEVQEAEAAQADAASSDDDEDNAEKA